MSLLALTRPVSATLNRCQLTHLAREPIDVARAERQHAGYEEALRAAGADLLRIPAEPDLPDAVFVEDTAIVLDEVAVLANPGAPSRRPEVASVANALGPYRKLVRLEGDATLDGGDVLVVDRTLYVGQSTRTNRAAASQLAMLVDPFSYDVRKVPVRGALHLKSAVTMIGPGRLLMNPEWVSRADFEGLEICQVDPSEPGGANALLVNESILYPMHFPRTAARLEADGRRLLRVDVSELAKAEGGVTCCSLVFRSREG